MKEIKLSKFVIDLIHLRPQEIEAIEREIEAARNPASSQEYDHFSEGVNND